jgi:26S proteasome regulatory subunit N12
LPESERKLPIVGLFLLYLLAEGRIGDFHTELELHHDHHDRYIRYSIDLERDIMEGRYNKVWSARQNPPRESYTYFVDKLMGTIRNDVASCIEASYESLTTADAAKLLFFGEPSAEFHAFCKTVRSCFPDENPC